VATDCRGFPAVSWRGAASCARVHVALSPYVQRKLPWSAARFAGLIGQPRCFFVVAHSPYDSWFTGERAKDEEGLLQG
jgi:hypothetical protein